MGKKEESRQGQQENKVGRDERMRSTPTPPREGATRVGGPQTPTHEAAFGTSPREQPGARGSLEAEVQPTGSTQFGVGARQTSTPVAEPPNPDIQAEETPGIARKTGPEGGDGHRNLELKNRHKTNPKSTKEDRRVDFEER